MEHTPPAFFNRGPAPVVRLMFFALASLALIILDARFRYTEGCAARSRWRRSRSRLPRQRLPRRCTALPISSRANRNSPRKTPSCAPS
jgi:hypothetical protein